MTKKVRNSNIEFLRLISALFILLFHFSIHQYPRTLELVNTHHYKLAFVNSIYLPLGEIGVNAFVLITGYYMSSKEIGIKNSQIRAFNVWKEMFLYSIFFLLVFSTQKNFAYMLYKDSILRQIFPTVMNTHWFVTAYIMLMLLLPFLNYVTAKLSQKQYLYLIIITVIFCDILPIFGNEIGSKFPGFGVMLAPYFIGGYLQRYFKKSNKNYLIGLFWFVVSILIMAVFVYLETAKNENPYRFYYGFFSLIGAVGLFVVFINMPERQNDFINFLGKHVFAIYLVADNEFLAQVFTKYLSFSGQSNLWKVNIYGFVFAVIILIACCLVDVIREWFSNLLDKMFANFYRKVSNKNKAV